MIRRLFERAFRRNKAPAPDAAPLPAEVIPVKLTVVPRDQHRISRKQISPNALRVLYRLREAGFAAYLVGGAVRDLLLDGHPKDFDVATDASPEQVKQQFRNCRLIGRRFRLAHVHYGPEIIEVATFRGSADDGSGAMELVDGRIVRDNVYGSIEDDAVRRDFTVNALYYSIDDFSVRDYVGGFQDINERVLRLIGNPERRFREDPVRMLRAARLAAKLEFSIEPAAVAAIAQWKGLLGGAPPARLFDECLKLFLAGRALASFRMLVRRGLVDELFPESARAMRADRSGLALVEAALENTDIRIGEDKPVTPAFLFAALLWPAVVAEAASLQGAGEDDVWTLAADSVVSAQVARIALPRRFAQPMQEIWLMQERLESMQRRRIGRLLGHPRFRAAFDFLALRAIGEPRLRVVVTFWLDLQGEALSAHPIAARLAGDADAGSEDRDERSGDPAAPKKRRRRRKPKSVAAADPGQPDVVESARTEPDQDDGADPADSAEPDAPKKRRRRRRKPRALSAGVAPEQVGGADL